MRKLLNRLPEFPPWNSTCYMEKCGFLAKRRGKRFQAVLAEIASQKLGGPPHRASDFFLFSDFCRNRTVTGPLAKTLLSQGYLDCMGRFRKTSQHRVSHCSESEEVGQSLNLRTFTRCSVC